MCIYEDLKGGILTEITPESRVRTPAELTTYKRLKISIRLILCNCCRDIELHWRGQGWATSVEGKGRESAAHRDTHSLPCTSINIHFEQERNSYPRDSSMCTRADVDRCKEVRRSWWRLKDCGKGHGQC